MIETTLTASGYETKMRTTAMAQVAMSDDGNPAALLTPDGALNLRSASNVLRVAIGGDSISEPYSYQVGNGATIVAPGVARMTFASAFPSGYFWPGDDIKVTAAPTRDCNTMAGVVTAIDTATRLWVEYTVSTAKENAVISSIPNLYRKYHGTSANYLAHAFAQAGIPYQITVDAALGGGDSEQINEILRRDWADCDIAFYMPGMNDIYSRVWAFSRIKAADIANLKIMRRASRLVIMSVPPRFSGNGAWNSATFAVWRQVNEWRRQYAVKIGAIFIDSAASEIGGKTYAIPTSVNSNMATSGTNQGSSDGIHPIALGAMVMGAPVNKRGLAPFPPSNFLPASASVNAVNGYKCLNPLMLRTTGGTTSGTATFQNLAGLGTAEIADGFNLNVVTGGALLVVKAGIVARSAAVHGDSIGNVQRFIVDNVLNASAVVVTLQTLSFHASMADGDSLEYGGHVMLSSAATPGSGDPAGLTSLSIGYNDQHATALNKGAAVLAGDSGAGYYPALSLQPYRIDKTRRVATAGAFTSTAVQFSVTIAANQSACIDVGRVLARSFIDL